MAVQGTQIVFHIGAHCTGQDRLVRSLLKNRDVLAQAGVAVPGPGKYRRLLCDAIGILRGARAAADGEEVLFEALTESDDIQRIVLSGDGFICTPGKVLEYGTLYPRIGKCAWLRNAFPSARCEFALTLRNMATFLPALHAAIGAGAPAPENFLARADPRSLRWDAVVEAICDANPGIPVIVWRHEDAAILWPEIMRELCDLDPLTPLRGGNDMTRARLSGEGNRAFEAAVAGAPPTGETARRRLVSELLADFAAPAETAEAPPLPGWTAALTAELTELYRRDVERIARMPQVILLEP